MEFSVNHPILFLLAGLIVLVVLVQSVYFLIKAYKRGIEIGMGREKLRRIAMTAAIAATVSENPVIIEDFQAVNKSYPDFLQDFALLGGKYQILED